MFKPVQKRSLSEAVFAEIQGQILAGKLEAGANLPAERTLSGLLEVNRGAVREALKRLEQARLVTVQQGGATRVLDFRETAGMELLPHLLVTREGKIDTKVAKSVLEMRSALAPEIARLAAERHEGPVSKKLADLVRQMEDPELPRRQVLALEFWDTLVEGSGNVAYRLAFNSMKATYEKIFDVLTFVLADEFNDLAGYRAIAQAVEKRDPARAERQARALIRLGESGLGKVLAALDSGGDSEGATPGATPGRGRPLSRRSPR